MDGERDAPTSTHRHTGMSQIGSTDMFRGRRSDSIGARVAAKLDVIVPCCFILV